MNGDEPRDTFTVIAQTEDGGTARLLGRKWRGYGKRFMTTFDDTLATVARLNLSGSEMRTLLWFMSRLDPIRAQTVAQREIKDDLGLNLQTVQKAIQKLEREKLIFLDRTYKPAKYRLNNQMVWKSTAERYQDITPDPVITAA